MRGIHILATGKNRRAPRSKVIRKDEMRLDCCLCSLDITMVVHTPATFDWAD